MYATRSLILALAATALAVPAALGQNIHTSRLYEQILENITFAEPGTILDSFGVVRMTAGTTASVFLDVPVESPIRIMGDCDTDCVDLDLAVYSSAGENLGSDVLIDNYPIVNVDSGEDGRLEIIFNMVDCQASYCYAAYSVFVPGQ